MFSLLAMAAVLHAAQPADDSWPRPSKAVPCGGFASNSKIVNPPELKSKNGVLKVTLTLTGDSNPSAETMCWLYQYPTKNGPLTLATPPTLHLKQGDNLVLTLINTLVQPGDSDNRAPKLGISSRPGASMKSMGMGGMTDESLPCGQPSGPVPTPDPRTGRIYGYHRSPWNDTNLHFHGLNTSPMPPGDNVTETLLCPVVGSGPPNVYNYTVKIPSDEPPGTYWYHPHPHGESERQVLSQLTGVIIIDTLKPSIPDTMPNRVIVVRDQGPTGGAKPRYSDAQKRAMRSRLPTIADIRTQLLEDGPLKPLWTTPRHGYPYGNPDQCPAGSNIVFDSKELIVNQVPLPPNPTGTTGLPATTIASGETQYWRFANTTADTIVDVYMTVNGQPANIMVTSRDGVPLVNSHGQPTWQPVAMSHMYLSPAARGEFYLVGTNPGDQIILSTVQIDTGCLGDVDLARNLLVANVTAAQKAVRPPAKLPRTVATVKQRFSDLGDQRPVRQRVFAFTEYMRSDEPEPDFYITELSNPNAVEHPYRMTGPPDVTVKQNTVEDWTILNYTQEVHEFHIHQIHFLVLKGDDVQHGVGQLLDTINVPYGVFKKPGDLTGNQMIPGAVKLRMDFRGDILGQFVFHCHILAHEDGGMMARLQVSP
jgi:FtsP/CotA-like multicopper oxidase with cupredoxin domain